MCGSTNILLICLFLKNCRFIYLSCWFFSFAFKGNSSEIFSFKANLLLVGDCYISKWRILGVCFTNIVISEYYFYEIFNVFEFLPIVIFSIKVPPAFELYYLINEFYIEIIKNFKCLRCYMFSVGINREHFFRMFHSYSSLVFRIRDFGRYLLLTSHRVSCYVVLGNGLSLPDDARTRVNIPAKTKVYGSVDL